MTTHTIPEGLELDIPADEPVIRFRRFVRAPRELLFRLMTEPEHLRQWWGPSAMEVAACDIDLRVGGTWRIVQRTPDGQEFGFGGEYREIDAPHRVVQTFVFDGFPDAVAVETMELHDVDGGTLIVGETRHSSLANRDGHVASGMEPGMRETYERLDDLAARAGQG